MSASYGIKGLPDDEARKFYSMFMEFYAMAGIYSISGAGNNDRENSCVQTFSQFHDDSIVIGAICQYKSVSMFTADECVDFYAPGKRIRVATNEKSRDGYTRTAGSSYSCPVI